MSNPFFERPIVNSPYEYPRQHWELDSSGQPTGHLLEWRRRAEFITPIPKPKKRRGLEKQQELVLDEGLGLTTKKQAYDLTSIINEVRSQVDTWRRLAPSQWQVTPETARLIQHWRHHAFGGVRPFFCQGEAVETAIWFTEVAPHTVSGKRLSGEPEGGQRGGEPATRTSGLETRHRRRKDDGHGDAHRLADTERRSPAREQALHARLPDRNAGPDDPRSAEGSATDRSRQLLRHP
jgi:type III restriction enzyme